MQQYSLPIALGLILALWGAAPLAAQEETNPAGSVTDETAAIERDVRKYVRRLNDTELAEREKAEQALVALGPGALSHLPEITERMPAEVKHRLGRVRQQLEHAAAERAVRASRVTLSVEDAPLADVLSKLEQQTGNKLIDYRNRLGGANQPITLTVNIQQQEFWPALDAILDQAKLTPYAFAGEPGLALMQREEGAADRSQQAAYAGVFRIDATRVAGERNLRNPGRQTLKLGLEIAWEPRLHPIAMNLPLASITAVGNNDQKIAVMTPEAELEIPVQEGITAVDVQVPFGLPPRSVEAIAQLSGKFAALVPGRMEKFEFPQLETVNRAEQRRGGVIVAVDSVRKANEDLLELRMRVAFDEASGALQSHRGWIFKNRAYLIGPDGKELDNAGFETTAQSENEVGLAYFFELSDAKGATFVYETPAAIVSMPVEFKLQDIPLP